MQDPQTPLSRSAAIQPWSLPPSLDLSVAEPLRHSLSGLLHENALDLDGAAVERVSTPCLQVIVAAIARARVIGVKPMLRNASPALSGAISELGLSPLFAEVM